MNYDYLEPIDERDPAFAQAFRVHAASSIDPEQAEKINEAELETARRAYREKKTKERIQLDYIASGRAVL